MEVSQAEEHPDPHERDTSKKSTMSEKKIRDGNRPNKHFSKIGWKNLQKKFRERTGLLYVHRQLRNRWDALKSYFQLWAKLVGQETGLGWDHEKKTVLASESWWTDKIKINPEFAKFKNEGPKSLDRLEQCFKDIVATGYSAWAPSEDPNPGEFNQNNEGFESGGDMNYTNEFIEEDIANYTVVQSPTREKRRKTSNKKVEKRAGIASRLQDSLDRILVGVESKAATKGDDPYSIENCIKLLRKLPGLEPYSPQFYLGIRLMAKPQYRETFIALSDDPNQQLGWLESFKLDDMNRL
ncbi:L10-interacting MYB domain-containing protein-like [Arachis duranensis]|uniref:L10-interacting MYB domain-containing protein-like n=1 Tax=Arachis duranensis TaxID=130453 RepID=A0A6P4DLD4_ARADU|nr:L10-interacting MYB domain-containing protein-like [Arachis duranensis]